MKTCQEIIDAIEKNPTYIANLLMTVADDAAPTMSDMIAISPKVINRVREVVGLAPLPEDESEPISTDLLNIMEHVASVASADLPWERDESEPRTLATVSNFLKLKSKTQPDEELNAICGHEVNASELMAELEKLAEKVPWDTELHDFLV